MPRAKKVDFESVAQLFYRLLDDIDTVDDIAKFDDKGYRKMVRGVLKKRWAAVDVCDGHNLTFKTPKMT